ncbi:hypothetical protein ACFL6U_26370 [Planctomycetota bacterium]
MLTSKKGATASVDGIAMAVKSSTTLYRFSQNWSSLDNLLLGSFLLSVGNNTNSSQQHQDALESVDYLIRLKADLGLIRGGDHHA